MGRLGCEPAHRLLAWAWMIPQSGIGGEKSKLAQARLQRFVFSPTHSPGDCIQAPLYPCPSVPSLVHIFPPTAQRLWADEESYGSEIKTPAPSHSRWHSSGHLVFLRVLCVLRGQNAFGSSAFRDGRYNAHGDLFTSSSSACWFLCLVADSLRASRD